MKDIDFRLIMENFQKGSVEEKIDIYCSSAGLSTEQYTELLRAFPLDKLSQLEAALA